MSTALVCLENQECCLRELAAEICQCHRSHLRKLWFDVVLKCVIIRGVATSYYGKQLALHEVRRRCTMLVVANQIEVEEVSATSLPTHDGG